MTPRDSHNYLSLASDSRALVNRRHTIGGIVVLIGLFLGYAVLQMKDVLFAPEMVIESPADGATIEGVVAIRGRVSEGSEAYMNGYRLSPNTEGDITADLPLAEGLHVLEFEARSSLGKISRVNRQIVVK